MSTLFTVTASPRTPPFGSAFTTDNLRQEERAREDAKRTAVLEEKARAELDRRQNHAASQIQRVLRAYALRQIANKGKKGKKGGGKKGKKGKK